MECPKCHLEIGESATKCQRCGTSLSRIDATDGSDTLSEDMTIAAHGFAPSAGELYDGPTSSRRQTEFSGDFSSRYTIEKEAERGGAGVVSLAWDNKLRRKVAIKRIKHQAFGSSGVSRDQAERSFLGEGAALVNVQHPNIVYVYDVGEDSEGLYIVMEYVDGGTLKDKVLKDGVLNAEEVARIGVQLCDALSLVHEKGIVHRDIKPGNILLTRRGTPKLVDFGLVLAPSAGTATQHGVLMGTVNFMSPEQKTDSNQVNLLSDIYSLGATLYFAATGKAPHAPNPNDLPAPVRGHIMKSLAENPSNRFGDAQEFLKALDSVIKVSNQGSDTYPCYLCGGLVRFSALFCSKCGKDMLEARKEKESLYRVGQERIRAAVERGEFESALRDLNELEKKLAHDHFAHLRTEISEKTKRVQGEWQSAETKKQDAEQLLEEAEAALDQLDLDKASKLSRKINSCTGHYFRTVADSAQRILDKVQAIEQSRVEFTRQFENAEKIVNDLVLRCEFDQGREKLINLVKDLKDKDLLIHREVIEKVESKLSSIEEPRKKAETLREQLGGLLGEAQAAFGRLDLNKAKELADEIARHDEPFFKSLSSDAEEINNKIHEIENTRQRFGLFLTQAEEAGKEHNYCRAFELLDPIISSTSPAYGIQRTKAEKDREKYLAEQTLEANKARKKRQAKRAVVTALALILVVATGIGISQFHQYYLHMEQQRKEEESDRRRKQQEMEETQRKISEQQLAEATARKRQAQIEAEAAERKRQLQLGADATQRRQQQLEADAADRRGQAQREAEAAEQRRRQPQQVVVSSPQVPVSQPSKAKINYNSVATSYVLRMIDSARDRGKLSSVKNEFEKLSKPKAGDKPKARRLNDQGLSLMRQYNAPEAISVLEEARRADPADVEITNNLSAAYLLTDTGIEKAKAVLVDTLLLKPDRSIAWANLAYIFAAEGQEYIATNCYINYYRFSNNKGKALEYFTKNISYETPIISNACKNAYQYVTTMP